LLKAKPKRKTLSELLADYSPHAKATLTPATAEGYSLALKNFTAFVGDCALLAVTAHYVDSYKASRLAKVRPATVNGDLRAIFNTARRWGFLESNPFARVQLACVPEQPPAFLSQENFLKLLGTIRESWFRELVLFAALTGMRRGEILNLRWEDVDLTRKLIHVRSTEIFQTKFGKRRTVPMNELVHRMLAGKEGEVSCTYIFHRRGYPFTKGYISHQFKRYVSEAGICGNIHFHSCATPFPVSSCNRG